RLGSAGLGWAWLGSARLGSAGLSWADLGWAQQGLAYEKLLMGLSADLSETDSSQYLLSASSPDLQKTWIRVLQNPSETQTCCRSQDPRIGSLAHVSSESLSVGSESLSAGSESLSAGSESLSVVSESLSAGSESLSAGSESLSAGVGVVVCDQTDRLDSVDRRVSVERDRPPKPPHTYYHRHRFPREGRSQDPGAQAGGSLTRSPCASSPPPAPPPTQPSLSPTPAPVPRKTVFRKLFIKK
ncbi:hypothetical protein CRUP_028244, partial [Coryphaenoides rupestris]